MGYKNPRAATAGADPRQILYNFVDRLPLKRVTEFVHEDALVKGYSDPVLKIVMASRKGHHFGHFKDYVQKLLDQAEQGITFLDTKLIMHEVLRVDQIERAPASALAGLQLADTVVSSTFQSIERASPHYADRPALELKSILAKKENPSAYPAKSSNVGMTLFPTTKVLDKLTDEQWDFFSRFGYDRAYIRRSRRG